MSDQNLTPDELADRERVSIRCVQRWRLTGAGPRYIRVSANRVVYPLRAVIEWETSRLAGSVTEEQQRRAS